MEELKDITKIKINRMLKDEERIRDYKDRIGNLEYFRVGSVEVRCVYAEGGAALNDRLRELIRTR